MYSALYVPRSQNESAFLSGGGGSVVRFFASSVAGRSE